jgi:tRNA pseudouridine55 synthase
MARKKKGRDVHGILLLDKSIGVSSNRALQEVKRLYNANKAGHTGSLDPLATGLLPVCFGEATKVSAYLLDQDKRYQVVVQLGVVTDTGDAEGAILQTSSVASFAKSELESCLKAFVGAIDQVPPMYSALKHQGKKLYEYARAGLTIERKSRRITIYALELIDYQQDQLVLDVHCSKGTYIRTLAEDIGQALGCGGTVNKLRRLSVGSFSINQAHTIEQLQEMDDEQLLQKMIAVDNPLSAMPAVNVTAEQAQAIKHGQALQIDGSMQGMVRIYSQQNFLGLGEMFLDGKLAPKKLFHLEGLG